MRVTRATLVLLCLAASGCGGLFSGSASRDREQVPPDAGPAIGGTGPVLEGVPRDSGLPALDASAVDDAGAVLDDAGEVLDDDGEVLDDAGEVLDDAGEVLDDAGEVTPDAGGT